MGTFLSVAPSRSVRHWNNNFMWDEKQIHIVLIASCLIIT